MCVLVFFIFFYFCSDSPLRSSRFYVLHLLSFYDCEKCGIEWIGFNSDKQKVKIENVTLGAKHANVHNRYFE